MTPKTHPSDVPDEPRVFAPAPPEPDWRPGHVIRDALGDVYAWSGLDGRPWVLLEHHHAGSEHLVGAQALDDWVWRPVEVIGAPVEDGGQR